MSQGFFFRNLRRLCRICNWACCVKDRVLMLTSLLSLLQAYKQMIQRRHTVYITHTSDNVQYLSLTDIHKSKLTLAYICLLYVVFACVHTGCSKPQSQCQTMPQGYKALSNNTCTTHFHVGRNSAEA
jgi:hypothetical protein